jgi:predicted metal-dependent hydrolase
LSALETLDMDTITIRQMPFEFPADVDPVFIEGDPEQSFRTIAGSLLLPYLEPYLIRSMKAAKKHVSDPQLLDDLKRFSAQEGQHYRAHMKFNEAIRLAGFPRLEELERELEDDYQRFSKTKSLRFNLAYAEGFEALTMNYIKFMLEHQGFNDPQSPIMQLFEWHFVEELEHRNVAFDVYDHVCGGYAYRLLAGIYAQWHFIRWIRKVAKYMLEVSPPPARSPEQLRERKQMARAERRLAFRHLLPCLLRIYLPSYSPHKLEVSPAMQAIADKYSGMATVTS